jgi:hypothetical protein
MAKWKGCQYWGTVLNAIRDKLKEILRKKIEIKTIKREGSNLKRHKK